MSSTCHRLEDGPAIVNDRYLDIGTVYYLNSKGHWHREDGPAIEMPGGFKIWIVDGYEVFWDTPLLGGRVPQRPMSKRWQEFIIRQRPDLIGQIIGLDPELKAKYLHEVELAKVDV